MIERIALHDVLDGLDRQAAVALIGARQVGKTTMARGIAESRPSVYLDLEDADDRARLADPKFFFASFEDRLVVLDEIHRAPEIFQTLRGVIDEGRRKSKGVGRFLILGSASVDLLRQSGESLAGRIAYVEMTPFLATEVPSDRPEQVAHWVRGGYPASYLAQTEQNSFRFRQEFIRTYLEREVASFGVRVPAETLRQLWIMLAHGHGTILNASNISRALTVSVQSVNRYIDLLCDLLLVRRLPAYTKNLKKRVVKAPKIYIRDSGLMHALLGIDRLENLLSHPAIGNSWEGYVIENICSALPWQTFASYYRTSGGAEVDLILELIDGKKWAIEIKRSAAAHASRGFYETIDELEISRSFIIAPDAKRTPLRDGVELMGLLDFLAELRELDV